jgi:thymidine kinase
MHIATPCEGLLPHLEKCLECDVIAFDEGQFFVDLVEIADCLTEAEKTVIIADLDGSVQRKPFGVILTLITKSESVRKLSAVCAVTGGEACFNKRMIDLQELDVIGGLEGYSAVSRSSFIGRPKVGEVRLTVGPVESGKTTELLRTLKRHQMARRRPVLIRSAKGSRIHGTQLPVIMTEAPISGRDGGV